MHNNFLTLYQNILNDLILKIESNELKLGSRLPSEQQLSETYNVSRITIRRALQELEKRGYILKQQGRGSFVTNQEVDSELFKDVDIQSAIQRMNLIPKIKLVTFKLVVDGKTFDEERERLGLSEDDYFYHIQYSFYGDDELMAVQRLSLTFDSFPLIRVSEINDRNIYLLLSKKYGFEKIKFLQTTQTGLIGNNEQKVLKIKTGSPFVKIEKKGIKNNKIVLYDEMFMIESLPMYLIHN